MLVNILMMACMYPAMLIAYFVMRNEMTTGSNRIGKNRFMFGVAMTAGQMADPEIVELTDDFKRRLKKGFIAMAIFPLISFVTPWFSISFTIWMLWILLFFVVLGVPYYKAHKRARQIKADRGWYVDGDSQDPTADDDHWIVGIFYYNPQDKHTMVKPRVGTGNTINMARPIGKILGFILIIIMLSLPATCIWVMAEEFVPIHLVIEDTTLEANHIRSSYTIPISLIEEIELLDKLPKMSRDNGTSMDTLRKGNFSNKSYGDFKVFLNPKNTVFLKIKAADTLYIMSGYDDDETKAIYQNLQNLMRKPRSSSRQFGTLTCQIVWTSDGQGSIRMKGRPATYGLQDLTAALCLRF